MGENARAVMKLAATATFKTVGLFVELNMGEYQPARAAVNVRRWIEQSARLDAKNGGEAA